MLYYIQTHIHFGTSSHENHHKTCHTSSSCFACLSFIFLTSWCQGLHNPTVFYFIVSRAMQPKGLVSLCQGLHSPTVFQFIVPRGTQHKGLIEWCPWVCIPRVFSSTFCSMYILVLSWHIIIVSILWHTYASINIMHF
jgi:hypothetical protein